MKLESSKFGTSGTPGNTSVFGCSASVPRWRCSRGDWEAQAGPELAPFIAVCSYIFSAPLFMCWGLEHNS